MYCAGTSALEHPITQYTPFSCTSCWSLAGQLNETDVGAAVAVEGLLVVVVLVVCYSDQSLTRKHSLGRGFTVVTAALLELAATGGAATL